MLAWFPRKRATLSWPQGKHTLVLLRALWRRSGAARAPLGRLRGNASRASLEWALCGRDSGAARALLKARSTLVPAARGSTRQGGPHEVEQGGAPEKTAPRLEAGGAARRSGAAFGAHGARIRTSIAPTDTFGGSRISRRLSAEHDVAVDEVGRGSDPKVGRRKSPETSGGVGLTTLAFGRAMVQPAMFDELDFAGPTNRR